MERVEALEPGMCWSPGPLPAGSPGPVEVALPGGLSGSSTGFSGWLELKDGAWVSYCISLYCIVC